MLPLNNKYTEIVAIITENVTKVKLKVFQLTLIMSYIKLKKNTVSNPINTDFELEDSSFSITKT